jgi:hypothetical protein
MSEPYYEDHQRAPDDMGFNGLRKGVLPHCVASPCAVVPMNSTDGGVALPTGDIDSDANHDCGCDAAAVDGPADDAVASTAGSAPTHRTSNRAPTASKLDWWALLEAYGWGAELPGVSSAKALTAAVARTLDDENDSADEADDEKSSDDRRSDCSFEEESDIFEGGADVQAWGLVGSRMASVFRQETLDAEPRGLVGTRMASVFRQETLAAERAGWPIEDSSRTL